MAYKKKEGKFWYIYFRIDGKQYHRSTKTSSGKLAERIRIKIEDDIAAGRFDVNYDEVKRVLLKDFLQQALNYSMTNKAHSTLIRDRRIFNNFLNYTKNVPMSSIKPLNIENYKTYLMNERHFQNTSINIELRHLSSAFSLAVKYNYITNNPFFKVKKIPIEKNKPMFLTYQQAERLLISIRGRSLFPNVLLAMYAGCRVSETTSLKWSNINFQDRSILIKGKGNKERLVPVPDRLYRYLNAIKKSTGYVCRGSRRADQVSRRFQYYATRIGVTGFSFHSLRHTYASWLISNGASLKEIQELLGHESIASTMVYAHLNRDNKYNIVKLLDKLPIDSESTGTNMLRITKWIKFPQNYMFYITYYF